MLLENTAERLMSMATALRQMVSGAVPYVNMFFTVGRAPEESARRNR